MQVTINDDIRKGISVGSATYELNGWGGSIKLNDCENSIHFKFGSSDEMVTFLVGLKMSLDATLYTANGPTTHSPEEIEKMKVFFGSLFNYDESEE